MWQVKPGHLHNHIDGRTLQHQIHLINSVTGGEHRLQLMLRLPSCAVCRRPFPQSDLGLLDPGAALDEAMALLNPHHEAVLQYSQRHNVPILLGELASNVPAGHRLVKAADRRLLVPPPRLSK